ncbi:unnamed protein product [Alternaria alternata]
MKFADDFMNVYEQLEAKVNEMINDPTTDERQRMAYSAFLFIIIHRCTGLERATQEERMRQMLNSVKDAWRNDEFTNAISSFQSFCGVLGMVNYPSFLSAQQLPWCSETGLINNCLVMAKHCRLRVLERSQHLPLRLTKTLLAVLTEKLRDGTAAYETAAVLWAETIPVLLPNLLQLVSHAQAFNDIESNWSHLPVELQQVIRRVLTDRFWQADFFYGIQDLPGPLSQALFGHAGALTAHHLSVLLTVSTHLIEGCPARLRPHFLPPMIQGLFRELDRKISGEWDEVARQVAESGDNDNLTDEMKTESIRRQLTYSSVSLVAVLLDSRQEFARHDEHGRKEANAPPMCDFILATPAVLRAHPPLLQLNYPCSRYQVRGHHRPCDAHPASTVQRKVPYPRLLLQRHTQVSYYIPSRALLCRLSKRVCFPYCWHHSPGRRHTPLIILSLPGMGDQYRVDRRLAKLRNANRSDERMQRSIVLDLLSSIKGVIHEQGKIQRPKAKPRTAMMEQYMSVDQQPTIVRGTSPGLAGVADMFGES